MADDITLTVRVRDLSHGELNRINQQVNRLQRDFNRSSLAARNASRGFRGMGEDIGNLRTQMQGVIQSGRLTQRQFTQMSRDIDLTSAGLRRARRSGEITRSTFRAMNRDVGQLRAQLNLLARQGNVFDRLSNRMILLQGRMRETNHHGSLLRRGLSRIGEGGVAGLGLFARGLARLGSGFSTLREKIRTASHGVKIFLLVLALIGPLAASVGAILTTALAAGFVAIGAFALRGDKQVRTAFTNMKASIDSVLTESAAPMRDALVDAMNRITQGADNAGPALERAFSAAAPLIDGLVEGVMSFGRSAMPGLISALQSSGPVMSGFRDAMDSLGRGFGELFKNMTKGGGAEGLQRAWQLLGGEIGNLLSNLGDFIRRMSESTVATGLFIGIMRSLSGVLHIIEGAFMALDFILEPLFTDMGGWSDQLEHVSGSMGKGAKNTDLYGMSHKNLRTELKKTETEIARIKKAQEDSDIKGPAKDYALRDQAASEQDLASAQQRRKDILGQLEGAEEGNAGAVRGSVTAYRDLLDAMQALAELNRNYLDAQAAQNKAALEAKDKMSGYTDALKWNGTTVDLTTKSGIEAYEMLSSLAKVTQESTDKAQAANAPWEQIQKNWKDGYNDIVSLADGMGLSTEQAKVLAEQILGLPPTKDIVFKARTEEAIASLDGVIAAMKAAPDAKEITVKALSNDAIKLLQDIGFTVTQMPDGSFTITAKTGAAKENIGLVQAARDALKGKGITLSAKDLASGKASAIKGMVEALTDHQFTITATYRTVFDTVGSAPSTTADALRKQAERFGASGGLAGSLPKKKFAGGGSVAGGVLGGPGTETSDSLVARLSRGEFVMRARAVRQYGSNFMRLVNEGRLPVPGFAKGGSVSKKEKEARNEARSDLTISHFGKMAGYKNDEFRKALGLPDALGSLVDSLNHWRSVIKKSTSGAVEKSLLKQLDKAGRSLIKYEKSLTKVEKSLDKAKEKLDGLKQASAALRDSVKNGVMSATNITQVASGDNNVTMGDVMARMRESVDKSTAFAKALADLKKKGVSKEIIQQIAEAGIEGGGLETAGAILGASSSEIATMNEMQKKINASAKSAGKTAADAMYAAGIKAAEGLVKGLTKKKKDIEKAMMNIAKAMEKSIKKALGIKSPSKVMQDVGHFTAEGFALGVGKNKKVDKAWMSMLHDGSSAGGTAAMGSAGGGGQYIFPIYVGTRMIDEVILDSNRRTVRTRGGNVQAVYGR